MVLHVHAIEVVTSQLRREDAIAAAGHAGEHLSVGGVAQRVEVVAELQFVATELQAVVRAGAGQRGEVERVQIAGAIPSWREADRLEAAHDVGSGHLLALGAGLTALHAVVSEGVYVHTHLAHGLAVGHQRLRLRGEGGEEEGGEGDATQWFHQLHGMVLRAAKVPQEGWRCFEPVLFLPGLRGTKYK